MLNSSNTSVSSFAKYTPLEKTRLYSIPTLLVTRLDVQELQNNFLTVFAKNNGKRVKHISRVYKLTTPQINDSLKTGRVGMAYTVLLSSEVCCIFFQIVPWFNYCWGHSDCPPGSF